MNQIDIKPTFPDLNNRFSTIVPSSVDLYDRIQAQTEKKKEDPNQREIGINGRKGVSCFVQAEQIFKEQITTSPSRNRNSQYQLNSNLENQRSQRIRINSQTERYQKFSFKVYGPNSYRYFRSIEKCIFYFATNNLENCKYKQDPTFVRVWIKFAYMTTDTEQILLFMYNNDIGTKYISLYESILKFYEGNRMLEKAEEFYKNIQFNKIHDIEGPEIYEFQKLMEQRIKGYIYDDFHENKEFIQNYEDFNVFLDQFPFHECSPKFICPVTRKDYKEQNNKKIIQYQSDFLQNLNKNQPLNDGSQNLNFVKQQNQQGLFANKNNFFFEENTIQTNLVDENTRHNLQLDEEQEKNGGCQNEEEFQGIFEDEYSNNNLHLNQNIEQEEQQQQQQQKLKLRIRFDPFYKKEVTPIKSDNGIFVDPQLRQINRNQIPFLVNKYMELCRKFSKNPSDFASLTYVVKQRPSKIYDRVNIDERDFYDNNSAPVLNQQIFSQDQIMFKNLQNSDQNCPNNHIYYQQKEEDNNNINISNFDLHNNINNDIQLQKFDSQKYLQQENTNKSEQQYQFQQQQSDFMFQSVPSYNQFQRFNNSSIGGGLVEGKNNEFQQDQKQSLLDDKISTVPPEGMVLKNSQNLQNLNDKELDKVREYDYFQNDFYDNSSCQNRKKTINFDNFYQNDQIFMKKRINRSNRLTIKGSELEKRIQAEERENLNSDSVLINIEENSKKEFENYFQNFYLGDQQQQGDDQDEQNRGKTLSEEMIQNMKNILGENPDYKAIKEGQFCLEQLRQQYLEKLSICIEEVKNLCKKNFTLYQEEKSKLNKEQDEKQTREKYLSAKTRLNHLKTGTFFMLRREFEDNLQQSMQNYPQFYAQLLLENQNDNFIGQKNEFTNLAIQKDIAMKYLDKLQDVMEQKVQSTGICINTPTPVKFKDRQYSALQSIQNLQSNNNSKSLLSFNNYITPVNSSHKKFQPFQQKQELNLNKLNSPKKQPDFQMNFQPLDEIEENYHQLFESKQQLQQKGKNQKQSEISDQSAPEYPQQPQPSFSSEVNMFNYDSPTQNNYLTPQQQNFNLFYNNNNNNNSDNNNNENENENEGFQIFTDPNIQNLNLNVDNTQETLNNYKKKMRKNKWKNNIQQLRGASDLQEISEDSEQVQVLSEEEQNYDNDREEEQFNDNQDYQRTPGLPKCLSQDPEYNQENIPPINASPSFEQVPTILGDTDDEDGDQPDNLDSEQQDYEFNHPQTDRRQIEEIPQEQEDNSSEVTSQNDVSDQAQLDSLSEEQRDRILARYERRLQVQISDNIRKVQKRNHRMPLKSIKIIEKEHSNASSLSVSNVQSHTNRNHNFNQNQTQIGENQQQNQGVSNEPQQQQMEQEEEQDQNKQVQQGEENNGQVQQSQGMNSNKSSIQSIKVFNQQTKELFKIQSQQLPSEQQLFFNQNNNNNTNTSNNNNQDINSVYQKYSAKNFNTRMEEVIEDPQIIHFTIKQIIKNIIQIPIPQQKEGERKKSQKEIMFEKQQQESMLAKSLYKILAPTLENNLINIDPITKAKMRKERDELLENFFQNYQKHILDDTPPSSKFTKKLRLRRSLTPNFKWNVQSRKEIYKPIKKSFSAETFKYYKKNRINNNEIITYRENVEQDFQEIDFKPSILKKLVFKKENSKVRGQQVPLSKAYLQLVEEDQVFYSKSSSGSKSSSSSVEQKQQTQKSLEELQRIDDHKNVVKLLRSLNESKKDGQNKVMLKSTPMLSPIKEASESGAGSSAKVNFTNFSVSTNRNQQDNNNTQSSFWQIWKKMKQGDGNSENKNQYEQEDSSARQELNFENKKDSLSQKNQQFDKYKYNFEEEEKIE